MPLDLLRDVPVAVTDHFGGAAVNTGFWTKIDTENKITVADGLLTLAPKATPSQGDPALVSAQALVRRAGLTLEAKVRSGTIGTRGPFISWANNPTVEAAADNEYDMRLHSSSTILSSVLASMFSSGVVYAADTFYWLRIVLKAAGALFYYSADGATWTLLWETTGGTVTPLHAAVFGHSADTGQADYARFYQGQVRPPAVEDTFTRADDAATLGSAESGQAYTADAGTWGISGNRGYSASDADGDLATLDAAGNDGLYDLTVRGTLNSAVSYRVPEQVFAGLDTNDFLGLRLFNGNAVLRKSDGGVFTDLASAATTTADATDYALRAVKVGRSVKAYKDGTEVISHTLAAGNAKYNGATYTRAGFRLAKAGAPVTDARVDGFKVQA